MNKILITNDDGFESPGIAALCRAFSKVGEVALVAPLSEMSGSSHSITAWQSLRVKEVEVADIKGYAVAGTPADTVILGLNLLHEREIDLVVSGVNRGPNLGFDVFYSGTVAAAMEASMSGIPSLAVSLALGESSNYSLAAEMALEVWEKFEDFLRVQRNLVLNINVPDVESKDAIKGWQITDLGDRFYFTRVRETRHESGWREFVFEEERRETEVQKSSDYWAVWNKKVSITPLCPNLTDYLVKNKLEEIAGLVYERE